MFDSNGSGEIAAADLRASLLSKSLREHGVELGPSEVDNMIRIADRDKSGTIEFDEVSLVSVGLSG